MPRVVDAILIDAQRAKPPAELEQRAPAPAPRDRVKRLLEAGARDTGTGPSQIVVDHLDGDPAESAGTIDKAVLSAPAFVIVQHLVAGRLANVDKRPTGEVVRRDLGHHLPPYRRDPLFRSGAAVRRPPRPAKPAAAGPACSAGRVETPSPAPSCRIGPSDCLAFSASPAPLHGGRLPVHEAIRASSSVRRSASRSIDSRGEATNASA